MINQYNIKKTKFRALIWIAAVFLLLSVFSAQNVFAETEYDFQGLKGTLQTGQGVKDYNNIKLVDPSDITVLNTTDNADGYFLNQINETIDGTTSRIEFAFCMTAGMNQIGSPGNWNFTTYNLDPNPSQNPNMNPNKKTQVNIYALEPGTSYTGKDWSKDKEPIINYIKGNLFIDDNKTYANTTNGDGSGRITLYTEKTLETGEYILEFGSETCGNNVGKILGVPVAFQFKVKGKYTFDEAIQAANTLYSSAVIGTQAGQYRDETKKTDLKSCIDEAQELAKNPNATVTQRDTMAEKLSNAIEALEAERVVSVTVNDITGVSDQVSVGSSGTAKTSITAVPDDVGDYRKYTWSASDNIDIDERTGEWTALWGNKEGEKSYIKATSTWQKNHPASIPDSEGTVVASQSIEIEVTADEDSFSVGIPKGESGDASKGLLQVITEKCRQDPGQVKKLKLFTARGASLSANDFVFIKKEMPQLEELDLSKATVDTLPSNACSNMTSLKTVKLPDKLSKISTQAFKACTALVDVEISAGVSFIGDEAFAGCKSLDGKRITINAVTPPECSQYPGCFEGTNIAGIKVPYGCEAAYQNDRYWQQFSVEADQTEDVLTLSVPTTGSLEQTAVAALELNGQRDSQIDTLIVRTEGNAVLNYAEDIPYLQGNFLNATTIDLSDAVLEENKFKSSTFKDRVNLKKVRLNEATTNIAGNSFYGCKNLSDIIIPKGLEKLGNGAFSGCVSLGSQIVMNSKEPPAYDGSIFPDCVTTIIVPPGSESAYQNAIGWRDNYKIIPQIAVTLSAKTLSLEVTKTQTLTAKVTVYNNNDKTIRWSSSNEKVATVGRDTGKVTAIKPGAAVITATTDEGKVTASCTVTVKAVAAPASIKASTTYNSAKITWSGVSGAAGYQVFRATKSNGSYSYLRALAASARSYTDTGRTTGTTYYYKVRAYKKINGTNYYGTYSRIASAKPLPGKVTRVKAARGGSKKIKVSWKKVSGASGYTVYRSTKKTKSYKSIKTVTSGKTVKYTNSKLKKGKRYYYKVRAYRKMGSKKVYGAYSSIVSYKAR